MLHKKLIAVSCLALTVLATHSAFARSAATETVSCPADAFLNGHDKIENRDSNSFNLGICSVIASSEYLTRGTVYWIRLTPNGDCPPDSEPATYNSETTYPVAIPNQQPLSTLPEGCTAPTAVTSSSHQASVPAPQPEVSLAP